MLAAWTLCAALRVSAAVLLEDQFTSPEMRGRDLAPTRGVWEIEGGTATCTQDNTLYARNEEHGPVIWYATKFTDATVRFAVRAEKVQQFVFTVKDDRGHVFRYLLTPAGLFVRAWSEEGPANPADVLVSPGPSSPRLAEGEWMEVVLTFAGDRCTLAIGPHFKRTVRHPAIAKQKTRLGLGFSYGKLAIRDLSVRTPE
jgi:hypothetical protein